MTEKLQEVPSPEESKDVYFIGGEDLEMHRIRDRLHRYGAKVVDLSLQQRDADVDIYREDIQNVVKQGNTPVTIELRGADTVAGVEVIDHHGLDYAHRDASISQVLERLGIEPNFIDKIVAANDAHYIQGMVNVLDGEYKDRFMRKRGGGEEAEERYEKVRSRIISSVRRADREAQGVTAEIEAEAEEALKHMEILENGLHIVRVSSVETSPVTDRLFDKWGDSMENLAVVCASDQEVNEVWFYGRGDICKKTLEHFQAKKQERIDTDPNEPLRRGIYHTVGGGQGLGNAKMAARCLVVAGEEEVISFISNLEDNASI